MATNPTHSQWASACSRTLKHNFRGRIDLYFGVDMLVYYERGNRKAAVAPDVFLSFGVPPGERASYSVWEEGKPPDVVWEFASPSTFKEDTGKKKEKYRRMGVREYWLVDPVGGYHDPRVQGFQLIDGAYERMPWKEDPDGMVTVWSPVLQLEVRFANGQLRFWDRKTAQYLELPEVEAEARVVSEVEARQAAEALRQKAEARVVSEVEARQKAEARVVSEVEARQAAEARVVSEVEARQNAEARVVSEVEARQAAEALQRAAEAQVVSSEQAIKAEKRARKLLEARIAESAAERRSSRDPT